MVLGVCLLDCEFLTATYSAVSVESFYQRKVLAKLHILSRMVAMRTARSAKPIVVEHAEQKGNALSDVYPFYGPETESTWQ